MSPCPLVRVSQIVSHCIVITWQTAARATSRSASNWLSVYPERFPSLKDIVRPFCDSSDANTFVLTSPSWCSVRPTCPSCSRKSKHCAAAVLWSCYCNRDSSDANTFVLAFSSRCSYRQERDRKVPGHVVRSAALGTCLWPTTGHVPWCNRFHLLRTSNA